MRRLLYLLPLLLPLSARPASAQLANAQGWCEQGANQVSTSGLLSTTLVQASFPQCTISVSIHGGGIATIYSTGASAPLSNPFTSATNGRWIFYAANGEYDITMTGGGLVTPVTYSDVFILTSSGGGTGPTLQTNGVTNTVQNLLNLLNGTNATVTADGSGGVTVTATPTSTTANCAQYNNAGVFGCAAGVTTPDGNSWIMKGQDPLADVRAFGARANVTALTDGSTTGTISSGTNSLAIASIGFGGNWVNGDGVTIQGAGATCTLSTPAAPTVTPSFLAGEAQTHDVVNSNTGASSYSYVVIARDKFGCLTPPSSTTTIANGLASLGLQTANVTAVSLSNDTLTVTTTTNLTAKTLVDLGAVTGFPWACCWFRVATNPGTTLTFAAFPEDSRAMPTNLHDITTGVSVGGTLAYYTLNYVSWPAITGAWEYYVCAQRPADSSLHVIGVTRPSDNGITDTSFEDLGATYLGGQSFPYYVTDAICTGAGQNDPLTTTVTAGAGTTTMTLAANAINSVTSLTVLHDSAPNILAAANSVSGSVTPFVPGTVYIPPKVGSANTAYPINSFLQLPGGVKVLQAGPLLQGETIETNATSWDGGWANPGVGQFGTCGGALTHTGTGAANPLIYFAGGPNLFKNMSLSTNSNAIVEAVDYNVDLTMDCVSMVSDGAASSDYAGMNLYLNGTSSVINTFISNTLFSGGPDQVNDKSWTPLVLQQGVGNSCDIVQLEKINWNRRGMVGGCELNVKWSYRQGGILPNFAQQEGGGGVYITAENVNQDTEGQPILANWQANNSAGGYAILKNVTGGGTNMLIQGNRLIGLDISNYINGITNGGGEPNRSLHENLTYSTSGLASPYQSAGSVTSLLTVDRVTQPLVVQGGYSLGAALNPPTSIACVNAAGGSIPNGTYVYTMSSIGYDGGSSMVQPQNSASCTTTTGNNTNNLTWVAVLGAVGYNVYRAPTGVGCTSGYTFGSCVYRLVASSVTGTSYSDTSATTTQLPPIVTATTVSGLNSVAVWGPTFASPETTAPSGVAGFDILYPDSTAHAFKEIANNGSAYQIPQTICSGQIALTTGAISSGTRATNTLTCTGLSASTDTISCTFSGDTNAVTGYAPSASGGLSLKTWASTNTINVDQVNDTSGSITPGAATVNCRGTR